LPKEGNQLKRLNTSLRPQAHGDKLLWGAYENLSNSNIGAPPVEKWSAREKVPIGTFRRENEAALF